MDIYESGQSALLAIYGSYQGQESSLHSDLDKLKKKDKKSIQEKGLSEKMLKDIYMIHSVVEELQAYMKQYMIPGIDHFDLRSMVTFSAGGKMMCLNTNVVYAEGKVHDNFNLQLNLNVEKLLDLPPAELKAVLTALIFGQLQNTKYMDNLADKGFYNEGTNSKEFNDAIKKEDAAQYEDNLTEYFDGFLSDYNPFEDYGSEVTPPYREPARIATRSMMFSKGREMYAEAYGAEALDELLASDPETAKMHLIAMGAKETVESVFSTDALKAGKSLANARNEKLLDLHDAALASGEVHEAARFSKQATFIASSRAKSSFESAKKSDPSSVENLCVDYAKDFLELFGFDSGVEKDKFITFNQDHSGDMGKFRKGPPATINIALENNKSVVETLMTCAHELTHFVDSKSLDRQVEFAVEQNKDFRWDDLSKLSATARKSPGYKTLERLHRMCYYLSPSEQSGRLGEMKALNFMRGMADGNYELKVDLSRNINNFVNYQQRVNDVYNGLSTEGSQYNLNSLEKLVSQIQDPQLRRMAEVRLEFVDKVSKSKMLDKTVESIKQAEEMQAGLGL